MLSIKLFPAIRKRLMIMLAMYAAGLGILLIFVPEQTRGMMLILAVFALLAVLFSAGKQAQQENDRRIRMLYNELNCEGFIREYEPLLQKADQTPSLSLMVRMHLSNAYMAMGRFEDAMKILREAPVTGKKEEARLLSRFAAASNISLCYEQQGKVQEAEKAMKELLDLKGQLERIQETKPMQQRMVYNTTLNEECLKLLKEGKCDVEKIKELRSGAQMLQRLTLSLWIANAYIADGRIREAREMLENVQKVGGHLYLGKEASRMLLELKGSDEHQSNADTQAASEDEM